MVSSMRAPRTRRPLVALGIGVLVVGGIGVGLFALKTIAGARGDEIRSVASPAVEPAKPMPVETPAPEVPTASEVKAPEPPPSASAPTSMASSKAKQTPETTRRTETPAPAAPAKPPRSSGAGYRPDSL